MSIFTKTFMVILNDGSRYAVPARTIESAIDLFVDSDEANSLPFVDVPRTLCECQNPLHLMKLGDLS